MFQETVEVLTRCRLRTSSCVFLCQYKRAAAELFTLFTCCEPKEPEVCPHNKDSTFCFIVVTETRSFYNFKFNKFNRNGFIFFIRSERNGTHQLVINEIKLHKLPRATQQNIYIVTNIYIFLSQDDYEQQQDGDDVVVDIFMSTQSPP